MFATQRLLSVLAHSPARVGAEPGRVVLVREGGDMSARVGGLHHVEIWVADLESAIATWGWLLSELGYSLHQEWPSGRSWRLDATYIVIEQSPALSARQHDRLRPGLNHLAFHAGTPVDVDRLIADAQLNGWRLLFANEHPHAGGDDHYAAYLENADGFEIELCSSDHEP